MFPLLSQISVCVKRACSQRDLKVRTSCTRMVSVQGDVLGAEGRRSFVLVLQVLLYFNKVENLIPE